MKTVLIAIDEFASVSNEPIELLEQSGFKVLINETGSQLDYNKNPEMYASADYIIAGLEPYPADFFKKFDNVNVISRIGVGTDAIDLDAATNSNVKVMITSDKPSVAVAELCISNMISILRSTYKMSNNLKNNLWTPIQGRELRSCTVGVIGVGSIGKEVLKRLYAFGSNLIGYSRTWDEKFANEYAVDRRTIEERERTVKNPKEKKKIEQERWKVEAKIKELEEKRWPYDQKIRDISHKIDDLDAQYADISLKEQGLIKQQDLLQNKREK